METVQAVLALLAVNVGISAGVFFKLGNLTARTEAVETKVRSIEHELSQETS